MLNNVQKIPPKKMSVLFRFSYRMRRVRLQSATACGAYDSNLLAYAPSTLASCYRMRRIRLQKTHFYTILLAYAPYALAICYRMRRIR